MKWLQVGFLQLLFAGVSLLAADSGFDMRTPARVRVTVVDEAGRPVAGAAVQLKVPGVGTLIDSPDYTVPRAFESRTDAQGFSEFAVDSPVGDAPGFTYIWTLGYLGASKPDHESKPISVSEAISLAPGSTHTRQIVLSRTRAIRIRFERPDGSRIPSLRFTVDPRPGVFPPVSSQHYADNGGEAELRMPVAVSRPEVRIGFAAYPIGSNANPIVIRVSSGVLTQAEFGRPPDARHQDDIERRFAAGPDNRTRVATRPPPPVKRVRLSIEDESGRKAADRLGSKFYFRYDVPGERFAAWSSGDSVSPAVFVPIGATQLEIQSGDPRLLVYSTVVELGPESDQQLRVRIPERVMPQPVTGVVLGKDGRPLAGIVVNAIVSQQMPNGSIGRSWLDYPAITDAEGRFETAAPATGELSLRLQDYRPLPGWSPPPDFTPDRRSIVIRLQAGGTVRIPPQNRPGGPVFGFALESLAPASRAIGSTSLEWIDPSTGGHLAHDVPPGRYRLIRFDRSDISKSPVPTETVGEIEVQAGREIVVDPASIIRNRP